MILLIGSEGSIGRRYRAVLEALGIPYRGKEKEDPWDFSCITKAIIASPTFLHFDHASKVAAEGIPFLCEKPMCFESNLIRRLQKTTYKGFVVNNWAQLAWNADLPSSPKKITYDFYNTGRDGLLWDTIQLIYLAKIYNAELSVDTRSYFWDAHFDQTPIPYREIEHSYAQMVSSFWYERYGALWTIEQALEQTEIIEELNQSIGGKSCDSFKWRPQEKQLFALGK